MLRVALLFLLLSTSFATGQSLHRHVIPQSYLPYELRDPTEIDILLTSKYVDLEERDDSGNTPLYNATMFDNTSLMKKLIDAGANINSKNRREETPLHLAAGHKKIETVRLLVSEGANLESKNEMGSTPLHEAVFYHKGDVIEYLIESGADVNAVAKHGSVFDLAINLWSALKLGEMLTGAEVNCGTPKHEAFPLHDALDDSEYKIFALLIDAGADVNAFVNYGDSRVQVAKNRDTEQYFIQCLDELGVKDICTECGKSTIVSD